MKKKKILSTSTKKKKLSTSLKKKKNLSTSTKIPFHLPVKVGRWDGDVHGGPHPTEEKNLVDVDEKYI